MPHRHFFAQARVNPRYLRCVQLFLECSQCFKTKAVLKDTAIGRALVQCCIVLKNRRQTAKNREPER